MHVHTVFVFAYYIMAVISIIFNVSFAYVCVCIYACFRCLHNELEKTRYATTAAML